MKLYRCALKEYLDVSGKGSFLFHGRFHSEGRYIVYATENVGSAMLEVLVRLIPMKVKNINQKNYGIAELEIDDRLITDQPNLKKGWEKDEIYTRKLGNAWYDANEFKLLKIPSVIVPETFNYLINVNEKNPEWLKITRVLDVNWDKRLI